jgi:hypothetical protein
LSSYISSKGTNSTGSAKCALNKSINVRII